MKIFTDRMMVLYSMEGCKNLKNWGIF